MKKLLLSSFVSAGLCFSAFTQIPDFPQPLEDTESNYYNLFNILSTDKVVVINFWALNNCPGCVAFSSTLEGIYVDYGSNAGNVIILSIEITQKSYAAIDGWRTTNSVTYPAIGGDGGSPTNGYQAYFYWDFNWKTQLGLAMPQLIVIHPDAGNPGNSTVDWESPFGGAVVLGDDAAIRASIDGYVGIQNQNLLDGKISIYPNPAGDYVNVQFLNRNSEEVNVSILNIIGEEINSSITTSLNQGVSLIRINTFQMVNGYYMVQLKTETATKTMRLQIIK